MEMPVTQNAVRVTFAISLEENAEKLLFLAYTI